MTTATRKARRSRFARLCPIALLATIVLPVTACYGPSPRPRPWPVRVPGPGPATSGGATQGQDNPDALSARQRRLLQVFGTILLNPSNDIDTETRRRAAEELIAMGLPEATARLDDALRSGEINVMLPVISAIEAEPKPVKSLLEPTIAALLTAPPPAVEPLSRLLVTYGDDALRRVAKLALDVEAPAPERLGPIHALGSFRRRAAAVQLMAMLDERRAEPKEITRAAAAALTRLTGLPYGANASAWTQWWREAKDQPHAQWLITMVQRLDDQLKSLKQQVQEQRQTTETIERRLFDTYRELYPVLSLEEQLRRLPDLLDDDLAAVRRFAISRLDRLLRDSVRIPDALQERLAEGVSDEVPELRLQAARLLDELNFEGTADRIAAALETETDAAVAMAFIDILSKQPSMSAWAPLVSRLTDPELGEPSATALWEALSATTPGADQAAMTREALREVMARQASPAFARLLCAIGDDEDLAHLKPLLDSEDPRLRAGVAEGMCRRGLRQPLLDRADDDVIYPFALQVIADGQSDLANLQRLLRLEPAAPARGLWAAAIVKLTKGLDPKDLLEADDTLAAVEYVDAQLRHDVLARVAHLPADTLPLAQRAQLVGRLASLMIELDEATQAHALLERFPEATAPDGMGDVRFRAAVLGGQYDAAVVLQGDPAPWVALFIELVEAKPLAAVAVRQEIGRRFQGRLNGELLNQFRAAGNLLKQHASASETRPNEPPE